MKNKEIKKIWFSLISIKENNVRMPIQLAFLLDGNLQILAPIIKNLFLKYKESNNTLAIDEEETDDIKLFTFPKELINKVNINLTLNEVEGLKYLISKNKE